MIMGRSVLVASVLTVVLGIAGAFAVTPTATRPTIPIPPVTVTGTTYTLTKDDCERLLRFTNSAGATVTTLNSLPSGCRIRIEQAGAGSVTIANGAGATSVSGRNYTATYAQYSIIELTVTTNVGGTAANIVIAGDGSPGLEPIVPAFYIATNGSDSNAGTLAAPFATFGKAQTEMRASGTIKTTYIRAGTYSLSSSVGSACGQTEAISLSSADAGETLSYYPPDGYNTAIIDAGTTTNMDAVCILGNNITINGLLVRNAQHNGIISYAQNTLIKNNVVHDIGTANVNAINGGCISLQGDPSGSTVTHNVVYNCGYQGIQAAAYSGNPGGLNNVTYSYNVVLSACTTDNDCGGLYFEDLGANTTPSTNLSAIFNYVRDVGISGCAPEWACDGANLFYMDLGTSNITWQGNVGTGYSNACWHQNSGVNNVLTKNICDLSTNGGIIIEYQGYDIAYGDMSGTSITSNIFISGGGGGVYHGNSPETLPTIANNVYHQYAGAAVSSAGDSGMSGDASPQSIDPQFSCWAYNIAGGSAVFNSPVNFPTQPVGWGQPGFWGPPGYIIPQTGTVPSSPHTC